MSDQAGSVVTINGEIDPEDLGTTITHEHTFINMQNWVSEPNSAYEKELFHEPVSMDKLWYIYRNKHKDNYILGSKEEAIEEISHFFQQGGDTIVDVTPIHAGRDPKRVLEVSRATGVQVVHGTAYYVRSAHPDYIDDRSGAEIEEEFVDEIQNGMADTDLKAGIIGEIGLSGDENGEMYEEEEKVLRAGARAALRTGAPLSVHPPGRNKRAQRGRTYPPSRWGLDILDIVEEEGLSPERVIICHMDRTLFEDIDYQLKLAERDPYLEFDLWGTDGIYFEDFDDAYPSDKWRIDTIKKLINDGFLSQIVVSQDVCTKIQRTKYGGQGYGHILRNGVSMLEAFGVEEDQVNKILNDNPREILTFEEPE